MIRLLPHFFFILLLLGCGTSEDSDKLIDKSKRIELKKISADDNKKLSTLQFPLDFPVNDLARMMNRIMPDILVNDTIQLNNRGDYLILKVEPIGRLLLNGYQNNLDASIPVLATVNFNKKVAAIKVNREVDFKLRLDLHTDLSIDENFNLAAACKIQKIHWIDEPETKLLGIKINLKNTVKKQLNKNSSAIEDAICSALNESVPIQNEVMAIWDLLNKTHRIAREPIDIWLTTNPSNFAAKLDRQVTDTIRAIISTSTNIIITPLKGVMLETIKPLPDNQYSEDKPGLALFATIVMPYSYADNILNSRLDQNEIYYNGLTASLENFRVTSDRQQLKLNFDLKGDIDLRLSAKGRPTLTAEKELSIDNIQYKIESGNLIVNTVEWISKASLESFVQEQTKIKLAHILDSLDTKIVQALNNSDLGSKIDLELSFSHLRSDTTIYYPDRFEWSFDIRGKAHAYLNDRLVTKKIEL
ncbi:MAG: DUF4403 family protein [Candidatus Cyclobacteriaceae bacterium M2_1C_046]